MVSRVIPEEGQKIIMGRLSSRIKYSETKKADRMRKWQKAEDAALAYLHETDEDALRRSDREQKGNPRYTTIQIPYSYASMMTAHTYMTSVFFARSPVHQFSGRHGETEQQVSAHEALTSYQVESGRHLVPYYIWLYDAGKYGCGILGDYWCEDEKQYSSVTEMTVLDPFGAPIPSSTKKVQQTFKSAGFNGTRAYNVAPFDFGHDPRFPLYRFQEGEYCWVKKTIPWSELLSRQYKGYYTKEGVDRLPKRNPQTAMLNQGSSQLIRPDTVGALGDEELKHPTSLDIVEIYVELLQKEWKLGASTYPEKWVFTISADYSTLLGCEPYAEEHCEFPFTVIETEIEGYGLYSRGLPEIIEPIQNTMDWLINTHFYNVRASLNNQFVIDPSKIVVDDAEDGGPGFLYRMRPEAYGTDVRNAFFQVPVQDMTRAHMTDMDIVQNLGERITGINEQMFGGISKSRTTATEVRTSTGFGVNRLKTITEYISAMGISPFAQRMISRNQQFYSGEKKFRIVGDLAQMAGAGFMDVRQGDLAGNFDFVPCDGALPIDRMAMATLWQNIMGQMRNYPAILAQFDLAKIFTYVAQLSGVRNVNQFKIQIVPDGLLQASMQQGNVVPMIPKGGPQQGSAGSNYDPNSATLPDLGAALDGAAA